MHHSVFWNMPSRGFLAVRLFKKSENFAERQSTKYLRPFSKQTFEKLVVFVKEHWSMRVSFNQTGKVLKIMITQDSLVTYFFIIFCVVWNVVSEKTHFSGMHNIYSYKGELPVLKTRSCIAFSKQHPGTVSALEYMYIMSVKTTIFTYKLQKNYN